MTDLRMSSQVGVNIRRIRNERGISLPKMGEMLRPAGLNLSKSGLSRLETGQRPITVDQLISFASVLDVSPSRLLDRVIDEATPERRPSSPMSLDPRMADAIATLATSTEFWNLFRAFLSVTLPSPALESVESFGSHAADEMESQGSPVRSLGETLREALRYDVREG